MPRRTKKEAAETRQRILDSALEAFIQAGYSRTTLDTVATRINLSKGAVYWHFKNKPNLILELVKDMDRRFEDSLSARIDNLETLGDIKHLLVEYAGLLARDESLRKYYTLVSYKIDWDSDAVEARKYLEEQIRELTVLISSVMAREQAAGRIDSQCDTEICAEALFTMADGLIIGNLAGLDQAWVDRTLATAIDVFLNGMQR